MVTKEAPGATTLTGALIQSIFTQLDGGFAYLRGEPLNLSVTNNMISQEDVSSAVLVF